MSALHRRIKRIEAEVTGTDRTGAAIVLSAPAENATAEAWAQHKQELAKARGAYGRIIVISDQHNRRQPAGRGVFYVPTELDAALEMATCTPSEHGNRDKLADILDGLSGKVLGPDNKASTFSEWADR